jgi:ABC-type nickel/cobalt efflux system permease component RcnA
MPLIARFLLPVSAAMSLAAVVALVAVSAQTVESGGVWSRLLVEVHAIQRDLHRQLAGAMRAVAARESAAAWGLVVLSLLYGVFHAAGPGHGKIVISTYLLTHESRLRRGVALSLVASLAQGITAILIVDVTVALLGWTFRRADATATGFEAVSYGLVALIGALLAVTGLRRLHIRLTQPPLIPAPHPAHAPDGDRAPGHGATCSQCGHAHGPRRRDLDAPISLRTLAGLILSIGIRPCSGAVLVLLAAHALGLRWAGIGAVLAMSIGTGLAVSVLAILSVYARQMSLRLAAILPDRAGRIAAATDVVGVIGGVVILAAGLILLQSAWVMPAHPLR